MFIYPFMAGSKSVKALRGGLGAKIIKLENSKFKGAADKVVINWGSSQDLPPEVAMCNVINPPEVVRIASNKLAFFDAIEDWNNEEEGTYIPIPNYTTKKDWVRSWLDNGGIVLARHKLNGHSGEGIELLEGKDCNIPDAPLYVKYIPKKQEYRVHVAGGQVVDVQRKARRHDVPDDGVNWRIRNHKNGFIFARNDLDIPYGVREYAVAACEALGLDFGAVDVIYNDRRETAYVIEVNTAPGLTGTTLGGYVGRFKNWGKPVEKIQGLKANAFFIDEAGNGRGKGVDFKEAIPVPVGKRRRYQLGDAPLAAPEIGRRAEGFIILDDVVDRAPVPVAAEDVWADDPFEEGEDDED